MRLKYADRYLRSAFDHATSFTSAKSEVESPSPISEGHLSILLIDKRPMLRDCVAKALGSLSGDLTILQATQPEEAGQVEQKASVCLLATGLLPIDNEWVRRAIQTLGEALPDVPIAVLSDALNVDDIIGALHAGIRGYLTTEMDLMIMIEAARFIRGGGIYVPAEAVVHRREAMPRIEQGIRVRRAPPRGRSAEEGDVSGDMPFETITPRELQVLLRLRQGKPNKIIAYELSMRESTVKVHVQSIMRKLGASNRTQVTYLTQALDLPEPQDADAPWDGGALQ